MEHIVPGEYQLAYSARIPSQAGNAPFGVFFAPSWRDTRNPAGSRQSPAGREIIIKNPSAPRAEPFPDCAFPPRNPHGKLQTRATFPETRAGFPGTRKSLSRTRADFAGTREGFPGTRETFSGTREGSAKVRAGFPKTREGFSETRATFSETREGFPGTRANFAKTCATFPETRAGFSETRAAFHETCAGFSDSAKVWPDPDKFSRFRRRFSRNHRPPARDRSTPRHPPGCHEEFPAPVRANSRAITK